MKRPFFDPDLHLFVDDSEISAYHELQRTVQTFRKDRFDPVVACDRPWEGSAIGTFTVLFDETDGLYKMWYLVIKDRPICYAVSKDGLTWEKPDLDVVELADGEKTNIVHTRERGAVFQVEHAPELKGAWPANSRFIGCEYLGFDYPIQKNGGGGKVSGIYAVWSPDGVHWERRPEPILPFQGDRTTLYYDEQREKLMLMTRHRNMPLESRKGVLGLKRDLGLWESPDLVDWEYRGAVLKPDEFDPLHTEFYGMTLFRYGPGFLGLLLMYHKAIEKLDVQLAWSRDGFSWNRVGRRNPCLTFGGEGSWDSHWVQISHNPPQVQGDRLLMWYNGGCTKHGSGNEHRKAVGACSIRLDGFVSMEAGREDGSLVTTELSCEKPKVLRVIASYPTGRFTAEVLDDTGEPIECYRADDCKVEGKDGTRLKVRWKNGASVYSKKNKYIKLRFHLYQGSLFSFRWSDAPGT